jgi:ferritin-like metal-binding protein YciE
MPATMSNPRDVYLTLLGDMLYVERTLSNEVLPSMLGEIHDPSLAGVLAEHLEETKAHVGRVEQAFRAAGAETSSNHSLPFGGLVEQHSELSKSAVATQLADVLHLDAALHTEGYEIASYRVLIALADTVAPEALGSLRENLAEEEEAEARLRKLLGELARATPTAAGVDG